MAGFANLLRNSTFAINQRSVSGTVTLAAGQYGHDGFKGGASGCTYTFAKSSGITTITITAGTLMQVIEGALYLPEGGPHNLSWLGTAPGRINGGTYGASSIQAASLPASANVTVEWGVGTLAKPQFEFGSKRSVFEYRDDELRRCQRYYWTTYPPGFAPGTANVSSHIFWSITNGSAYNFLPPVTFPITMRSAPTVVFYSPVTGAAGFSRNRDANADIPMSNFGRVTNSGTNAQVNNAVLAAQSALDVHVTASAEL